MPLLAMVGVDSPSHARIGPGPRLRLNPTNLTARSGPLDRNEVSSGPQHFVRRVPGGQSGVRVTCGCSATIQGNHRERVAPDASSKQCLILGLSFLDVLLPPYGADAG